MESINLQLVHKLYPGLTALKTFITMTALIWLLICVTTNVSYKKANLSEILATRFTLTWCISCSNLYVWFIYIIYVCEILCHINYTHMVPLQYVSSYGL